MHKIYLLLRNNKQTGPYSLEELLQLDPRPLDLVWVEGRSAGWKYPSEIESLKPFITSESTLNDQQPITIDTGLKMQSQTETKKTTAVPGKIYISLPAVRKNSAVQMEPSHRNEAFEKKAEELYARAQAVGEITSGPGETEVRYTRSLDDIKEEYSSWLYAQKHKSKSVPKKKTLRLGVAGIVMVAILFFIYNIPSKKSPVVADSGLSLAYTVNVPVNEEQAVSKTVAGKNEVVNKPASPMQPAVVMNQPDRKKREQAAGRKEKPKPEERKAAAITKPKQVATRTPVDLPELIEVKANYYPEMKKGVTPFDVTVTNNSNETLRLVAIDLIYYNKKEKMQERKTLYFDNIVAGATKTKTAPANRKAIGVRYQLGLVTSAEGEIYARQ